MVIEATNTINLVWKDNQVVLTANFDCSDVGEKCWWKKVCWWRISVMLVKGMLVKKSIFMYVGEECWRRKLCMLVKNFSNVSEIVMLVKNLLLRCWWITEKHFHACWWMMLVKMGMLVKDVGEKCMMVRKVCWRRISVMLVKGMLVKKRIFMYVSEANIPFHQHTFTNIPSPTYSFHQHKISQIFSLTYRDFTN